MTHAYDRVAPCSPCCARWADAPPLAAPGAVAYLKGLLTAGEVVPATRQYRDRMLGRVVADALQRRVDAAAGQAGLPVETALQLVANVAALMHALAPLDEFALAQARGETAETSAAAAAAASRSPSPRRRSRSVSPGKAAGKAGPQAEPRGRQKVHGSSGGEGQQSELLPPGSPASSHGSAPAPSPPSSPRAAAAGAPTPGAQQSASQQASQHLQAEEQQGSQQSAHTVQSFSASGATAGGGAAGAAASGAGNAAAAFAGLLSSAESLAVQAVAAAAAELLAAGEQLDWVPAEQQRSTAHSGYMEDLILYLKVSDRWCQRWRDAVPGVLPPVFSVWARRPAC